MRIVLLSDRAGPGRPQVRPGSGQVRCLGPRPYEGRAKASTSGPDPDPRANGARPCPWTVYESPQFLFLCIFFPLVWRVTETLPYSICHYGMNLYDVRGTNCCSICMLWIRLPRQSRRFQMLRNTPVCSEMLRTLLNIFWHLNFITNYYYLIIHLCSKT